MDALLGASRGGPYPRESLTRDDEDDSSRGARRLLDETATRARLVRHVVATEPDALLEAAPLVDLRGEGEVDGEDDGASFLGVLTQAEEAPRGGQTEFERVQARVRIERALASPLIKDFFPIQNLTDTELASLTFQERVSVVHMALLRCATSRGEIEMRELARIVRTTDSSEVASLLSFLSQEANLKRLLSVPAKEKAELSLALSARLVGHAPNPHRDPPEILLGEHGGARRTVIPHVVPGLSGLAALRFEPVAQTYAQYIFPTFVHGSPGEPQHPADLVALRVLGPEPTETVMPAISAALLASIPSTEPLWDSFGRAVDTTMVARAAVGFGRAVTAGSGALGARVVGKEGATFAVSLGAAAVSAYRAELHASPEGRAFLKAYDVFMAGMLAVGGAAVATKAVRELVAASKALLPKLGTLSRETEQRVASLAQALARLPADKLGTVRIAQTDPPGVAGALFVEGYSKAGLLDLLAKVRGELLSETVVTRLTVAGRSPAAARTVFSSLLASAESDPNAARALLALASKTSRMTPEAAEHALAHAQALASSLGPGRQSIFLSFVRAAGRRDVADPALVLEDALALSKRQGVSREALSVLADKARRGKVDLHWLRDLPLGPAELNYLGATATTPWKSLKAAALANGGSLPKAVWSYLRGVSGEMVTERLLLQKFPGCRVERQVVTRKGSILDFRVTKADGTVLHAVEVKAWREQEWRKVLDAWSRRKPGVPDSDADAPAIKQFGHMLDQLRRGSHVGPPMLVVKDLPDVLQRKLGEALKQAGVTPAIMQFSETELVSTRDRLIFGLKLWSGTQWIILKG